MKKRYVFILSVIISALLLLSACGGLDNSVWTPDPPAPPPEPPPPPPVGQAGDAAPALLWMPGTYSGVGSGGFGGDISVDVYVNEHGYISNIIVTDHSETQAFFAMAEIQVLGAIIAAQSPDVDTFGGATMTSEALISAVEDALRDARPDPALAAAAAGQEEAPALTGWTPGTFSGVGTGGFGGDIYLDVVINEHGQIAAINVTGHSETQAFFAMAEIQVLGAIIAAQTAEVDTFGGATLTSEALINAVEDALSQAER